MLMKISSIVLAALALAPAALAFSVPQPKLSSSSTRLSMSTSSDSSSSSKSASSTSWDLPDIAPATRIEAQTRRTWKFPDISREIVQVACQSDNGRPMHAEIELWIGPDWTPFTLKAYSEDGLVRPFQTLLGTRNKEATVEIRNVGPYELPITAAAAYATPALTDIRNDMVDACADVTQSTYVEGGAVTSFPLDASVNQVQILLSTAARQLHANVELLNGPNNVKQKYQVFTNNGLLNSLCVVFNTPDTGNVVRIRNLAPVEFPLRAAAEPVEYNEPGSAINPVMGGSDRPGGLKI